MEVDKIIQKIKSGKTLYIQTQTNVTKIDKKTLKRFGDYPVLKPSKEAGFYVARGKKYDYVAPNNKVWLENTTKGETTMKIKLSELKQMISEVLQEDEFKDAFGKEVEETLEPVSAAAGNPLKSVKAKKAARILAKEEAYVRKLVREELKFVMFNDIEDGVSRKRAKKRIAQKGSSKTNSTI